jgi:predicted enzyme related to lactoylglutathione lyase
MGNPVVHFEINAPDTGTLQKFYSELFGWHTQEAPGGYLLIDTHAGSGINGGIGTSEDGSSWATFYVGADDPQAVLDKAEALGGKTVKPVTEIPGMVTYALFTDPDGLKVGVVKNEPGTEAQGPSEGDGAAVDWFEALGSDAERTKRFYSELFGWKLNDSGFPGYALVDTGAGDGIGGGLGSGDGSTWVTVYASVEDIEGTLARAEDLGGQKVTGPNDVGQGTQTAAIRDPAGIVFGVYYHKHPHD